MVELIAGWFAVILAGTFAVFTANDCRRERAVKTAAGTRQAIGACGRHEGDLHGLMWSERGGGG